MSSQPSESEANDDEGDHEGASDSCPKGGASGQVLPSACLRKEVSADDEGDLRVLQRHR